MAEVYPMRSIFRPAIAVAFVLAVVPFAGCNLQKSSSPLDPTNTVQEQGATNSPSPVGAAANRAADPEPGQRLGLPDMSGVIRQVAAQHPGALQNSCGNWEFMDLVVDELRKHDTRWGYNWKRGNVGDPSHDVVDYHWAGGTDEGSTDVYIIDVITGHCGDNPQPGWGDVTDITYNGGSVGRWTSRGRF
jgi:hypothetical protein